MPLINSERLLSNLRHLRTIGAVGQGVVRPAFSAADMAARDWLRSQFEEASLPRWMGLAMSQENLPTRVRQC